MCYIKSTLTYWKIIFHQISYTPNTFTDDYKNYIWDTLICLCSMFANYCHSLIVVIFWSLILSLFLNHSPIVNPVQSELLSHVSYHHPWDTMEGPGVTDGDNEWMETLTRPIRSVQLGIHDSVSGRLTHVTRPNLHGLKVWGVQFKLL